MIIRIATRASPLAIAQANEVRDRILAFCPEFDMEQIVILPMKTTGDLQIDRSLTDTSGKGLFTKELEQALLSGQADIAVHSMKDMPVYLPKRLVIGAILPREDPRDAYLSIKYPNYKDLPIGAVIGSSSVRRKAQFLKIRPDLKIIEFRGNVQTRLQKLTDHQADATLLAVAGLKRLKIAEAKYQILEIETILPAIAQGAIGVECKNDDSNIIKILRKINHLESELRVKTERGFLAALDGDCKTPLAALATISAHEILLKCLIAKPNGSELLYREGKCASNDGEQLGLELGKELRAVAGDDYFA